VNPSGFDPALDAKIESSPRAPATARRVVDGLAGEIDPNVLRDAQLLVSEVVTNSIRHSGSDDPIGMRIWLRHSGVKVEIADSGTGFDAAEVGTGGDAEGGRGLMLVEALADRWGVSSGARTRVWFELSLRPVSRAQAG
jgi:anti-sigma regulatory factor (Ser/Thr protein kinase)